MSKVIKISKKSLYASVYSEFWDSLAAKKHTEYILEGGRASFKSSTIALRLILNIALDPSACVGVFMQYHKYIRHSVYTTLKWAIQKLQLTEYFDFSLSPLGIFRKDTKSGIYFFGLDDSAKIKGTSLPSFQHWSALWFEEFAEIKDIKEVDVVISTLKRGMSNPAIIYSFNPPKSLHHFIYEFKNRKKKDTSVFYLKTTYKDDDRGFHCKEVIKQINKLKKTNPKYYSWAYLGKGYMQEALVYPEFSVKNPPHEKINFVVVGVDFGSVNPTAFEYFGVTYDNEIYGLHEFFYQSKDSKILLPDEQAKKFKEISKFIETTYAPIRYTAIDPSATALKEAIRRIMPTAFLPVDNRIIPGITAINNLIASGKLHFSPNQKELLREISTYSYDKNKLLNGQEVPIKENDHCLDATRYAIFNIYKKLNVNLTHKQQINLLKEIFK